MKKHVLNLVAVIAMALSPQSGQAQKWLESFGKGLDKVNNALEQVDNALSGKSTKKITSYHASIIFIGDDMAIPADLFFLVTNPDDYKTILNHAKKHMQSADDYSTLTIPHDWQVEMTYHDGYFIP